MKNGWQIIALLLAVALVVMTLKLTSLQSREEGETTEVADREAIGLDIIMTRSSVRSYSDKAIEAEKIEKMLRAGMAAPTAKNAQPWEFYVITNREIIKRLTEVTPFAAPMNEMAQAAIVVCGVPSESVEGYPLYWVQDTSAATENILLAAHAMGLGAVWCGVTPVEERVATLREMIEIPERLEPLNFIMVGYPNSEPNIKDKWRAERVHYIK